METKEFLVSIKEVEGEKILIPWYSPIPGYYSGYRIQTTTHSLFFGIEEGQQYCESTGFISSEEDFSDFIGAEILDVSLTDTELKKYPIIEENGAEVQFIDISTTKGLLQFVVYNSHNGHYGHTIVVTKDGDLWYESSL